MAEILQKDLKNLLKKSLNGKMKNFEVVVHEGNKKGEGFLGEILFLSVKNKKTKEDHHLVIKQVLPCENRATTDIMSASFINETCLYTKILPAMQNFQKSFGNVKIFENFPNCYASISERGKEKIVLDNIKFKNYDIHPKQLPLTSKMYEEIFKLYGQYHAISFALKVLRPQEFSSLVSPLNNNWPIIANTTFMSKALKTGVKNVKEVLEKQNDEQLLKRYQKYVDNCSEIFKAALQYKGAYGIITHGDSWSNNMMWKYTESGEVEDIKLIDFQLSYVGSPVYDLSYSFYSGASKETLDDLEKFLKIYHNSLNENLNKYGLSADKIYPFEALMEEWKEYCPFGFVMGYLVWEAKFIEEGHEPDLSVIMNETENVSNYSTKINKEKFAGPAYNLVKHMCEKELL